MCISPSQTDRTTIIVPDPADEAKTLEVAKQIAAKTGRTVIVQDSDGAEIDTFIPTKRLAGSQ